MKITEKFYSEKVLESVIFYDKIDYRTIIDVDFLFKMTNRSFAELLKDLGLNVNFDFSLRDNKKLYLHEFIKNICDFLKANKTPSTLYFYSNLLTKDPFRNSIIKKMKSIFGFQIWEEAYEFGDFVNKIENEDCSILPGLEVMFSSDKAPKSLRKVKKSLDKMGLTYLNDVYFQDVVNKQVVIG